jgi:glutathione S-transferase
MRRMKLRLVIANKNYSSWSMRPWLVLKEAGIAFEEILLPFDSKAWDERAPLTPTGKVPVLWIDQTPIHDSLAIAETIAELFPAANLWPSDRIVRAQARAVSAEMHSGFAALRRHMPMNIEAELPGKGELPEVRQDIARVVAIWEECRTRFAGDGSLLFGPFTIADAMFAPVVTRLRTYGVTLPPVAEAYAQAVLALPSVAAWCDAARGEHAFVAHDEPYRDRPA